MPLPLVGPPSRPASDVAATFLGARLADFGDRPALVSDEETVSYADLARRVEAMRERLGTPRRLVLVTGRHEVEPVVAYLAALAGGHPVVLVPGDNEEHLAAVTAAYDPDVLVTGGGLESRRTLSAHDLHPDLALLLSTSGSTGTPKLVRLSQANLRANATAIASYLGIRDTDVAATTLPMHYCYGLSVLNSHLLRGAALMLTSRSVVDPGFWDSFREHGVTSFAGVPYTFDLLDRVGFTSMDLPTLRYVTQAGGRLAPERVRGYAAAGRRRGWDLFVMYGQTEATARMAYLPPDLAESNPSAIGVPIPGGSFALDPLPSYGPGAGELVYSGDNVMLGYASGPGDLALGRTVDSLRTGDIARRTADGLYEIVGRTTRFAKLFGLRVDLDRAERLLAEPGTRVFCVDAGDRLVVAVEAEADEDLRRRLVAAAGGRLGLPPQAVAVLFLTEVPRLASGKPDYRAVAGAAAGGVPERTVRPTGSTAESVEPAALRRLFGELLNRSDVTDDDSFVTLAGDSLSYVEMSIRLEEALGHLPAGWHVATIGELAAAAGASTSPPRQRRPGSDRPEADRGRARGVSGPRRRGGWRSVETNVLLRAAAIVAIVGSHGNLFVVLGGAHLLLGVAGFNFARFHLTTAARRERTRHLAASLLRIVVPSVLWIGVVAALSTQYTLVQALLLNGVLGPQEWAEPQWYYWFIEALVYTLGALGLLLAVPWVDRLERRWSFWFPVVLVAAGLLTRYEVVTLVGGDVIHRAHVIFWIFGLGWATSKAHATWQRLLVSVLALATVPGFFEDVGREGLVVAGLLLLVWVPAVRVPSWLRRVVGVLAGSSLYVYLVHWQIYPHFEHSYPAVALLLSLAGGIALWQAAARLPAYVRAGRVASGRSRRLPAEVPGTCTVLTGVACVCAGPGPRCGEK